MAYQQAQGVDFQELYKMHTPLLVPDLTFIVDVPVEVALERMRKDSNRVVSEQKFEDPKNRIFIENLRQLYLGLPKQMPHSEEIVIVDGTKTAQEIFENQIKPVFDNVYQRWEKR
jgi:thymidylate kinase